MSPKKVRCVLEQIHDTCSGVSVVCPLLFLWRLAKDLVFVGVSKAQKDRQVNPFGLEPRDVNCHPVFGSPRQVWQTSGGSDWWAIWDCDIPK